MSSDKHEDEKGLEALDHDENPNNKSLKTVEILKLNVGGTKFYTTRSTLLKSGYFRALLSGNFADSRQDDGYLFIDRDPVIFGFILKYLRCDYVSIPTKYLQELDLESKFLQIDLDLSSHLESCKPETISITQEYGQRVRINGKKADDVEGLIEVCNILKKVGIDATEGETELCAKPIDLAAIFTGRGYRIVSSTLHRSDNVGTGCIIRLDKMVPEYLLITKRV